MTNLILSSSIKKTSLLVIILNIIIISCSDSNNPNSINKSTIENNFDEAPPAYETVQKRSLALIDSLDSLIDNSVLSIVNSKLGDITSNSVDSAIVLYEMGIEAFFRGSIKVALYCFLRSSVIDTSNSYVYGKIGFCFNQVGYYKDARDYLKYSIKLDSTCDEFYVNLATSYLKIEDTTRAIAQMNKAMFYQPLDYWYYFKLAEIHMNRKDTLSASLIMSRAKSIAPQDSYVDDIINEMGLSESVKNTTESDFDYNDVVIPTPSSFNVTSMSNEGVLDKISEIVNDECTKYQKDFLQKYTQVKNEMLSDERTIVEAQRDEAECNSECSQSNSICENKCRAVYCEGIGTWTERRIGYESMLTTYSVEYFQKILTGVLNRSYSVIYNNPDAPDIEYALTYIADVDAIYNKTIISLNEERNASISNLIADYDLECNNIGTVTGVDNTIKINIDVNFCMVIICITINDKKISLGGNISFVNVNLEIDMKNNDVKVGFGVTAYGLATVRLDFSASGEISLAHSIQFPLSRLGPGIGLSGSLRLYN